MAKKSPAPSLPWKEAIESLLRNEMRYCFSPSPTGDYPTLDEQEFNEFLGAVRVVFWNITKDLWMKSYYFGSMDALEDAAPGCYHVDEQLNKQGAERRWQELQ